MTEAHFMRVCVSQTLRCDGWTGEYGPVCISLFDCIIVRVTRCMCKCVCDCSSIMCVWVFVILVWLLNSSIL